MKRSILAITILAMAMVFAPVNAIGADQPNETKVTVNLEDLSSTTRDNVLKVIKAQKKKESESILDKVKGVEPEDVEKWGQVIAKGIETVCTTLSVEVNEFIETPVGMVTAGLIAYQVVGDDIRGYLADARGIIFGLVLWVVGLPIVLWSYVKFHVPKKVKVRSTDNWDGKGKPPVVDVKYKKRYEFNSGDAKCTSAVLHAGFFATILLTGLLMMV